MKGMTSRRPDTGAFGGAHRGDLMEARYSCGLTICPPPEVDCKTLYIVYEPSQPVQLLVIYILLRHLNNN